MMKITVGLLACFSVLSLSIAGSAAEEKPLPDSRVYIEMKDQLPAANEPGGKDEAIPSFSPAFPIELIIHAPHAGVADAAPSMIRIAGQEGEPVHLGDVKQEPRGATTQPTTQPQDHDQAEEKPLLILDISRISESGDVLEWSPPVRLSATGSGIRDVHDGQGVAYREITRSVRLELSEDREVKLKMAREAVERARAQTKSKMGKAVAGNSDGVEMISKMFPVSKPGIYQLRCTWRPGRGRQPLIGESVKIRVIRVENVFEERFKPVKEAPK